MPELEAAPSVADVLPGGDSGSIVDEPIQGTDVLEEGTPESPEPIEGVDPAPVKETPEDVQDGRVLSPDMRSLLKGLKGTNPKLEKNIRGMAFALHSLKEQFPGGTKEAIELKNQLQQFGGLEGIKPLQESSAKLAEIDDKLAKGDASVVDSLAEMLPAEGYAGVTQKLLGAFGAKDAEGYQRLMSGVIANTFEQSGIQHHLARIADYIKFGQAEEAQKMLQSLGSWMNEFRSVADKKPEVKPADPNVEKFQQERQQLDQEKAQIFTNTVSTDVATWSKSRVTAEAQPFLKGRKLNEDQSEALELKALGKVRKTLMADENFKTNYAKYFNAKDKDGLLKFIKAETDKLLPSAVKDSFRVLFSDFSPKPKPQPDKNDPAAPVNPAATGFIKVSGPPKPDQVDHARTPFEWKMRSKAVLKDGRRVTWA
jgi:hypothetical protein